jgi:hypothetical protein
MNPAYLALAYHVWQSTLFAVIVGVLTLLLRKNREIAAHLQMVFASVPKMVKTLLARADSGFYCWTRWKRTRVCNAGS